MDPQHRPPALATIDAALEATRAAAHLHHLPPLCKAHLEHAIAHLFQAWIAASGQTAQPIVEHHQFVARAENLLRAMTNKQPT